MVLFGVDIEYLVVNLFFSQVDFLPDFQAARVDDKERSMVHIGESCGVDHFELERRVSLYLTENFVENFSRFGVYN